MKEWKDGIEKISKCPNVHIKLSGMGMCVLGFELHKRKQPASSEELAALWEPYINHCIECFGAERCMFASNFPVDKVGCGYTEMWNAFKIITKQRSED
jgi:predicted TIM-barrel fold metal-dependent hydrolase